VADRDARGDEYAPEKARRYMARDTATEEEIPRTVQGMLPRPLPDIIDPLTDPLEDPLIDPMESPLIPDGSRPPVIDPVDTIPPSDGSDPAADPVADLPPDPPGDYIHQPIVESSNEETDVSQEEEVNGMADEPPH
jgi:hypothetical protein